MIKSFALGFAVAYIGGKNPQLGTTLGQQIPIGAAVGYYMDGIEGALAAAAGAYLGGLVSIGGDR